jgi:hypothetical protein
MGAVDPLLSTAWPYCRRIRKHVRSASRLRECDSEMSWLTANLTRHAGSPVGSWTPSVHGLATRALLIEDSPSRCVVTVLFFRFLFLALGVCSRRRVSVRPFALEWAGGLPHSDIRLTSTHVSYPDSDGVYTCLYVQFRKKTSSDETICFFGR